MGVSVTKGIKDAEVAEDRDNISVSIMPHVGYHLVG